MSRIHSVGQYEYPELRAAAIAGDQEAAWDLAEWFARYDAQDWNGESWNMDDGYRLFPVYAHDGYDAAIVGWEVR